MGISSLLVTAYLTSHLELGHQSIYFRSYAYHLGTIMAENPWHKLSQAIDRDSALRLVDQMISWDNYVEKQRARGKEVSDSDLRILYDMYDYFFAMVLKVELEQIDNLNVLLMGLMQRAAKKHKHPFYEGFFFALAQMSLFRKLLLTIGENQLFAQWSDSFRQSLSKLE